MSRDYGGWEPGAGTRLCYCSGYVLASFRWGDLVSVELHHVGTGHYHIEQLDRADWLAGENGPAQRANQSVETPSEKPTTRPARPRRGGRTPDGRARR